MRDDVPARGHVVARGASERTRTAAVSGVVGCGTRTDDATARPAVRLVRGTDPVVAKP